MQQGSSSATKWQYEGGAFDPQSGELVLRLSNVVPAMKLLSIWRARPGRGPVEHWMTIANNSGTTITIGHQDSLVLSHLLLPTNESMDAWWIKRGASNATTEGGTLVQSVGRNTDQTLTSDPTEGASPGAMVGTANWCVARIVRRVGIFGHWGEFIFTPSPAEQVHRVPDLIPWESRWETSRNSRPTSRLGRYL